MRPSKTIFLLVGALSLVLSCFWWNARPVKKKVVFIGDSLTEWYDWQRRFPDKVTMNLGIAGEPVEGLLQRREVIRARIRDPDYIFLMTGINNIGMGRYDITAPYREIVRNLTTWNKRSKLVVQSILPVEIPGLDNSVIEETNRQLEQIAREHNAEYLDIYRHFIHANGKVRSEYLDEDGVHLSSQGYQAWSNAVAGFLQK